MALSYNSSSKSSEGAYWRVFANLSPDTSYATGGYTIIPERIGLTRIEKVSVPNNPAGIQFNWDSTTGKLLMGGYAGGGGAPVFTGTPMGNHTHPFSGAGLAPHTHTLSVVNEDLTAQPDTFCLVAAATGFFVVGETITGGTSGATAVVTVGNINPLSDLGFTPGVGSFSVGETITGGTSGTTAVVASGWYSIFVPSQIPICLTGAARTTASGRSLVPTANDVNADLTVTYTGVVGSFADFETITGGTSGNTATVLSREAGTLNVVQVSWTGGSGFLLGETITGGTSGATATVTTSIFKPYVVYRPTGYVNPNGDFIVHYPVSVNQSPMRFAYVSKAGASADSAGTPAGTVDPNSAGTPAGTIAGGGAIAFAEFPALTNVYALLNAFDVIIEGV